MQREATPLEAPQEATPPHPPTQRRAQENCNRIAPARTTNASQASSSATSGEKRSRRAVTGHRSLNMVQLSANSMYPQTTIYTDPSTSEREDTSIINNLSSLC